MEKKNNFLINLNRVSLMDSDNNSRILHDISMEVKSGEKFFLLARPYSPAVHLLRICATTYPPTSVTVTLFGRVTNEMSFRDL